MKNSYYAKYLYARQFGRGYFNSYPVGFDLTAIQSSLIDFSLSHQFSRFVNISAAMFYKRTNGQVQVSRQKTDSTIYDISYYPSVYQSYNPSYYRMANQGNSEISGLDLRIDKNIHLGKGFSLLLYLRVLNLFNTRQVENVYPYSGTAETDGMINDDNRAGHVITWFGEKSRDIYNALNTTNGQSYRDITGNELYRNPRQIFCGIRLNY